MHLVLSLFLVSIVEECLSIRCPGFLTRCPRSLVAVGPCRRSKHLSGDPALCGLFMLVKGYVCVESVTSSGDKIVYVVNPRGFCEGVERAIRTVQEAVRVFGPPIYVKHEIVHNEFVCNRLRVCHYFQRFHVSRKRV